LFDGSTPRSTMSRLLLVACIVFCFVLSCRASNLYAIVTEFSQNDEETRVYTVSLDRTTGKVTNVSADLIYAGGSATLDGVSAFDQRGGRYFFATDSATSFIYESDVIHKDLLAPRDIGAIAIENLAYDGVTNRLFALYLAKSGLVIASIGPQTLRPVLQIPSQFNQNYVMKGTVDGTTGTYYLSAKIGNTQLPTYAIATINIMNGQIIRTVAIDNTTCTVFPEYIWFDTASGDVLAGAESFDNNQLHYHFLRIDPVTGRCTKTALQAPVGIVTDWSYDSSTHELWFSEATNSGAFLLSYNIQTGKQSTPVLVRGGVVPESIEVSLFH